MGQPAMCLELPRYGTVEDYFEVDAASEEKFEYFGDPLRPDGGEIVAMAGGTLVHGLITVNVSGELRQRTKGTPCRAYSPDTRIVVRRHPTYTYPDVTVICGPEQPDPNNPQAVAASNPTLIVEVLSPSTESDDRGRKFKRYLQSDTLQEYVMVEQDEPRVEAFFRHADGNWLFSYAVGVEATIRLRSVNVELPLAEVYLNVTFPPAEPLKAGRAAGRRGSGGGRKRRPPR